MPLHIKTIEHLQGDYGLYTWPCAPVLAQYVYSQRDYIKGKRVLELGAGTAIPGLVAAKCGAQVILSDREENPHLLDNLKKSCDLNNIAEDEIKIVPISWGIFSPAVIQLEPQDLILASDCFYDSKDFEDIIAMVAFFFKQNPACKFWTTYQERSSNRNLHYLFVRWDLQCKSIPVETFYNDDLNEEERVKIEGPSESKLTRDLQHIWSDITKVIDELHIHNHNDPTCKDLYSFEKIKAENPHYNTMSCEQTFAWLSRYKKILCSMNKTHFHFYLHRLVKRRNKYITYCYANGRKPLQPVVKAK